MGMGVLLRSLGLWTEVASETRVEVSSGQLVAALACLASRFKLALNVVFRRLQHILIRVPLREWLYLGA